MLGKDYVRGFVFGMIAALLIIVDLFTVAYFTTCPTVCRWTLYVMPFMINLFAFCPPNYINWIYRRVVFWICLALFLMIALNIFGALFVTQEQKNFTYIMQMGFDTSMLTLSARRIVYCTISHTFGTVASIIVVAIRKIRSHKKHLKRLQEKQFALKHKKRKKSAEKKQENAS